MATICEGNKNTVGKSKLHRTMEPYYYLLPTLFFILALLVTPIIMVIGFSFYENVICVKELHFVGLNNYIEVLKNSRFWKAVTNTLFFVSVSIIAHLVLGMTFAVTLNSKQLRKSTKSIFRMLFVLPWMFTGSVVAILWKMMLNPNGIVNYILNVIHLADGQIDWLGTRSIALLAVTFINIWSGYPFYFISILAGLQGISTDLYEAASIDGANCVQKFLFITVPQLKSILISLLMLDFIWTMQQFTLIWMTTGGGPIDATETLSTFIYKQAFSKFEYAQSATVSVILLILSAIIAVFYVRHQRSEG